MSKLNWLDRNWLWVFIAILVFFVGMVGGAGMAEVPEEPKEVTVKECPAEKTEEIEQLKNGINEKEEVIAGLNNHIDNFKELKKVDDKVLEYNSQGFYAASDGFNAISSGDYEALNRAVTKMENLSPKIDSAVDERKSILDKLGY